RPLNLQEEIDVIEESIAGSEFSEQIEFESCLDATGWDLLSNLIRKEPAVLHFGGHGSKSGLFFEGDENAPRQIDLETVKAAFRALPRSVRLVFLNACHSEQQAEAVGEIIDFTIGMNKKIGDPAAIAFAHGFYTSLCAGGSVSAAHDAGIAALRMERILDEDTTPVLMWGDHADPDRPFFTPDDPGYKTRRTIHLSPPASMLPADGYDYSLKWVREGLDRDRQPLRNSVYRFNEYDGTLECVVDFRAAYGLQFKCYVECPEPPASLDDLPANWVEPELVGNTIWFLLDDARYVKYETRTGYRNNYLPSDDPTAAGVQGGRVRTATRARRARPTPEKSVAVAPTPPPAVPVPAGNGARPRRSGAPLLTDDLEEFIASLLPGDVLLLDSLHPLSGLIQFAENRPVSHAAIYLGKGVFAQTTKHSKTQPAARKQPLRSRLKTRPGPYDRTVTALRHVDVLAGADATAVLTRVDYYVDPANTKYAYLNLVALMAPSLLRSYKLYLSGGRVMSRSLGFLLQRAANTLLGVFNLTHRNAELEVQKGKRTLTCSEFVYRCYTESGSGLGIEVVDPLVKWKSGRRVARARSAAPGDVDGLDLVELHAGITSMLPPANDRDGADGQSEEEQLDANQELALRTVDALGALLAHNLELSKYDRVETVRGVATPRALAEVVGRNVVADLVTPRDLWSSPS
ncbi:MAG: CHAT domain-containing protein, partial [Acidimicrobiales bacterium]|nr:CHAT domain-containing protein [Acidimicrobiales bacterium]